MTVGLLERMYNTKFVKRHVAVASEAKRRIVSYKVNTHLVKTVRCWTVVRGLSRPTRQRHTRAAL